MTILYRVVQWGNSFCIPNVQGIWTVYNSKGSGVWIPKVQELVFQMFRGLYSEGSGACIPNVQGCLFQRFKRFERFSIYFSTKLQNAPFFSASCRGQLKALLKPKLGTLKLRYSTQLFVRLLAATVSANQCETPRLDI